MVVVQKRTIRWAISLLLVMLYYYGMPAQAQYGGGSGTAEDPYLIFTAEQLNEIGANLATEIIKNKLPSAKVIDLSTSIILRTYSRHHSHRNCSQKDCITTSRRL